MTAPTVTAEPTRYTVSVGDSLDASVFDIDVEYRGDGMWAVVRNRRNLAADGMWDWEQLPSGRTDEWLARHRFDLDAALKLARDAILALRVNGRTAAQVLTEAASP